MHVYLYVYVTCKIRAIVLMIYVGLSVSLHQQDSSFDYCQLYGHGVTFNEIQGDCIVWR